MPNLVSDGVVVILVVCISTPVQVLLLTLMARRCQTPPTISASRCRAKARWGSALSPSYLHRSGGWDRLAAGPRYRHSISTRHLSHGERLVALALLTVVVVTPIGEEMLFRGFLFRG
jgi:hypothetical protein